MVKFLITGLPRSGTTVISGSVSVHPEILFYGELLNHFEHVRYKEATQLTIGGGLKTSKEKRYEFKTCSPEENGSHYLQEFYSLDANSKAIGFKLLYHQARNGLNSEAWRYLANNNNIKIIATRRENLLDIVCSWVKANQSRVWHISGDEKSLQYFKIPIKRCEELFNQFSIAQKIIKLFENKHDVLKINYQMINNDFGGTMSTIYDFLELDTIDAKPLLKKIAQNTPKDELINYDELKKYFSNSQYAKYFCY